MDTIEQELDRRSADPMPGSRLFSATGAGPTTDVADLQPETGLDNLETTTQETGNAILRRVLQAQWETIDAQLMENHRQCFPPSTGHR